MQCLCFRSAFACTVGNSECPSPSSLLKTYAEMDLEAGKKHIYVFLLLWGKKKEPTKDRNNFQKEVFVLGHNLKGHGLQCWGRAAGEAF